MRRAQWEPAWVAWVGGTCLAAALLLVLASTEVQVAFVIAVCAWAAILAGVSTPVLVAALILLLPFARLGWGPLNVGPLIVGVLALQALLTPRVHVPTKALRVPALLFVIALGMSFIASGGDALTFGYLATALVAFFAMRRLLLVHPHLRTTVYVTFAVLAIGLCGSVLSQLAGLNPFAYLNQDAVGDFLYGRTAGPFQHPITLGITACGIFAVLLPGLSEHRVLARLGLLCAGLTVGLSQTRIALFAAAVVFLVYFLRAKRRRVSALIAITTLVGAGVVTLATITTEGGITLNEQLASRFESGSLSTLPGTVERFDLWNATIDMWKDNRLGVGVGQYSNRILEYGPGANGLYYLPGGAQVTGGAENLYLHILAEIGPLGLLAFLLFIAVCLRHALRLEDRTESLRLVGFWVAIAITALTAQTLLGLETLLLGSIGLALTFSGRGVRNKAVVR